MTPFLWWVFHICGTLAILGLAFVIWLVYGVQDVEMDCPKQNGCRKCMACYNCGRNPGCKVCGGSRCTAHPTFPKEG